MSLLMFKNEKNKNLFHLDYVPEVIDYVYKLGFKIALLLSIVGGLNWGSIGFFGYDFVAWIFGGQNTVGSRIIYSLVGVAAIWCISLLFKEKLPAHNGRRGE